ncbi:MAG TPA: fimbria/pilus periplasmic chaperone [Burkholderiaceae bacterium]|nr:fimbria/pilus periplasmic chaperone [Burkholderiaceae bacterium]
MRTPLKRRPASARSWWRRLAALGAGLASTGALAAALEASPVVHEVPAERSALAMSISNRGAAPVTVQVRAFEWSQPDGDDRLVPAPTVLLSPPIFTLEPGRSQIVRALLPAPPPGRAPSERSWRLLVDEIPDPRADAAPIRFALRLSIPVFHAAPRQASAALEARRDDHALVLRNQGGRRARLRDLALVGANGERWPLPGPSFIDLLAGAPRRWSWPVGADAAAPLRIVAVGDAGAIEVPLAGPGRSTP